MALATLETIVAAASLLASAVVAIYAHIHRRDSLPLRNLLRGTAALLLCSALMVGLAAAGLISGSQAALGLAVAVLVVIGANLPSVVAAELRRDRQLRLTRTAATILIPTTELQPLLNRVLDLAHAAVRVDGSSVMLLDPQTRELYFVASRGLDPARTRGYKVALDHPAIASVWPGHGPLIVSDVLETPGFRQLLVRSELRSFFGIPMVTRDTMVGFLNVHRLRPSQLKPGELQALTVLASQAAVAIHTSRLYADLKRRYLDTISGLASAVEVNDPKTLGHCRRVAEIARLLAEEMGLDAEACEAVEVTALLHDVGKIGVSNDVLRKLGRLTPEEMHEVRAHSELGAAVLRDVESLRDIAPSILYHHERWDGTGYPAGLKAEDIPLPARLVAVADAYEVMTAGRPYRQSRTARSTLDEIKRMAGRQFDPTVVDALVRVSERGDLPAPSARSEREEQSAVS